jgi:hypothetical protein
MKKTPQKFGVRGNENRTRRARTWLADFINARLDTYVEPQRQGTPKGAPIGLSRIKYAATLFRLYGDNLKQLGHQVGVPHIRMRQWAAEPAFKQAVAEHQRAFADVFFTHILDATAAYDTASRKASRARWSLTPKQLASPPSPSSPSPTSFLSGLGDFPRYSASLHTLIMDRLSAEWKRRDTHLEAAANALEKDDDDESVWGAARDALKSCNLFLGMWMAILRAGDLPFPPELDEIHREITGVLVPEVKRSALAMIKHLAAKPRLSDDERKLIISLADDLEHTMDG